MVALSKNSKNKLNKIYRKLDLGGGLSQDQMVRQKLQEQEKVSSGAMVGGQATANTVGTAIPIAGAFKAVGEGAATAFRQDDEYGVAATDEGAAVGGVFNPLKQTMTGISAIGKGDAKTAFLNLAAPPLAAYLENKEARKTRDAAIRDFQNKQSIELATQRGKQTAVNGNQVYSLTERKQGGKLSLLKYPDGGLVPNKTSKTQLNEGQQVAYDKWKSDNKYNESDDYDLAGYWKKEGMKKLGSPKGGEHFTDKFKRLAPFGEGDGYQQLSDESNVASQFDKRGQGYWDGDKFIAYKQGGKLSALSSNTMLATGATHEEGGIKLPQLGAEVEDKETLKMTKDGGTYVMSDTLVNPTSGNTFAKDDLRLSKMKGRLEKINHSFGKNALTLLKNKEQKLVDLHEQVRQEQGLETADGTQVAKHGGLLKYSRGGGIDDTFDKSGNWASDNEDGFQNNFVFKGRSRGRVGDNNTYTYDKLNDSFTMNGKSIPNTQNNYLKSTFNITNSKPYLPSNPTLADQAIFDAEKPQLLEEPITKLYGSRRPISVSSTEPVVDSNTTGKTKSKFDVSSLSKLTPYIDNITAAIYNNQRSKEKLPNLKTLDYLNPNLVNYSQALKDTRDTTTAYNRGVDTTNVNQGNANIMKAFALGEQQKGIARISQEESNVNVGIKNDFAGRNKAIEEHNNMTIFNNAERNRLGRDEIRREGQQNIVDANMKLQTQLKSRNQESDDKDAELAHQQKSIDFIESKKAEREANESGIWKNGRFMRSSNRNGGKLSKLKISY